MMISPVTDDALGEVLRLGARERSKRWFIHFLGSVSWTYEKALTEAESCAGGLSCLGVRAGDR